MTETPTAADALAEQLWQAIADTRDAYPRVKNDAPTDEVVVAVLPVFAAELRRIAVEMDEERESDSVATDGSEFAEGERGTLISWAEGLRRRADELDPPARQED